MIYLLIITIYIYLILAYKANHENIAAPSFLFTASFAFSSVWTLMFADEWNFELHFNTYLVITLGILEFIIVSYLYHYFYKRIFISKLRFRLYKVNQYYISNIPNWKLDVLIIVEIITILLTYKEIIGLTGTSNLVQAMYIFDQTNKFTDETLRWSWFTGNIRMLVDALGLWSSVLLANQLAYRKKINIRALAILLLSAASELMISNRGTGIIILLSCFINYFGVKCKNTSLKIGTFVKIVFGVAAGLIGFEKSATLLGREVVISTGIRYFALYIAGGICNLDKYLQQRWEIHQAIGSQTFVHITTWIRDRLGMPKFKLDIPFQSINGYNLGNVYTTFYDYIYDGGYVGVFVFVFLMAIICQRLFEDGLLKQQEINLPSFSNILYGYAGSSLLFAFFSNMFYQAIFKVSLVKYIICWLLISYFIRKRIVLKKKVDVMK